MGIIILEVASSQHRNVLPLSKTVLRQRCRRDFKRFVNKNAENWQSAVNRRRNIDNSVVTRKY